MQFEWLDMSRYGAPHSDITALLNSVGIGYDNSIEYLLVMMLQQRVVGCAGLAGTTIRCVAVSPQFQGAQLAAGLLNEVEKFAYEQGRSHLFLYTKPSNEDVFKQCGFYPLVSAPKQALLMENTPVGLAHFCQQLSLQRHDRGVQGGIVMNANPFTFGHRYLVEQALLHCDWLHVFVVREEASEFSYRERFAMVCNGLADLECVSVHSGGQYLVSRATFPNYFLKDKQQVEHAYAAIDLLLFRDYIAPSLRISRRFVGTEPYCPVTAAYNAQMYYWLAHLEIDAHPAIDVIEIPRTVSAQGTPISASQVRRFIQQQKFKQAQSIVPQTTFDVIQHHIEPVSV
ncbi:[citrate (pro-3S)-lyase] ligase [Celerinatantimonas yamalensis]|uniref:[Citrate [pro-3S]-lyase] ligase n=1 Tax=Celerinatantimonas yamalensis TaxID=559956 RepID=A0ABW9GAD6_9GAMM